MMSAYRWPLVLRVRVWVSLKYPAARVEIDLGTLGPDAVTVGAAIVPLADFFVRGGRRAEADPEEQSPAWEASLRERTAQ
jgi:hypothetical protein